MAARTLDALTIRAYYVKFLEEYKLRENESLSSDFRETGSVFREWLKKRTPETKPLHQRLASIQQTKDNLTRLIPDWHRKVGMSNLLMKTILRIYLSKWFYQGLEWYEAELIEEISRRIGFPVNEILERAELYHSIGFELMHFMLLEDDKKPVNLKGWDLIDYDNSLMPLLFTKIEYEAIWKLRSFQSLRDFLFTTVDYESLGKKGIKRRRIRGYRDGKAKSQDPTRTALARKVDQLFYEEKYLQRWNALQSDIEVTCSLNSLRSGPQ